MKPEFDKSVCLVIVLILLTMAACAKQAAKPEVAAKQSPYPINELFKLEQVSVATKMQQMGGFDSATYVPTIRVTRLESGELPPATGDLWVWEIYASGTPAAKEVEDLMLYPPLVPNGEPRGTTYENTAMPKKVFRMERRSLTLTPAGNEPQAAAPAVLYFAFLAPEKIEERWQGANVKEISFLIEGFDAEKMFGPVDDPLHRRLDPEPPPPAGMAAVALCGFQPELVCFSKPLILTLK